MQTTADLCSALEMSSRRLRCVRVQSGRVVEIIELPIPAGNDPVEMLEHAALPGRLGPVRVVMAHDDILVRTLSLPPCPADRLDKLVRFELLGTDPSEPLLIDWRRMPVGGDEFRILALVAKAGLVKRLQHALAKHGGTLAGLTVPAVALISAWSIQRARADESAILVDIGGSRMHLALMEAGEPILLRTTSISVSELGAKIADLRNLSQSEAADVLARVGNQGPDEILDVVRSQLGQVAAGITAAERFAKASFKLEGYKAEALYVSGAGAQVPAALEALARHLQLPVRVLNPFAQLANTLTPETLDPLAGLPSPWTPVLGATRRGALSLDVVHDVQRAQRAWWMQTGLPRVGLLAALLLVASGITLQEISLDQRQTLLTSLSHPQTGAVVLSTNAQAALQRITDTHNSDRRRLAWLAQERDVGRNLLDLLAAVSAAQDPSERPVQLGEVRIERRADGVYAQISGQAHSVGNRDPAAVLRSFEVELKLRLPSIVKMTARPVAITSQSLPFSYAIMIRPADA